MAVKLPPSERPEDFVFQTPHVSVYLCPSGEDRLYRGRVDIDKKAYAS